MLHDDSQEALKARGNELQQRYEAASGAGPGSYTPLRAIETRRNLVWRLLLPTTKQGTNWCINSATRSALFCTSITFNSSYASLSLGDKI